MTATRFAIHLGATNWQREEDAFAVAIRGTLLLDDQKATPGQLADRLASCTDDEAISKLLTSLNGFHSWVVHDDAVLRAGVDQIRSLPLFFAQTADSFFLSDEADWVREQVGNTTMDPVAREEFRLAGYVTGDQTLYPDVKQLQAGEYLTVEANGPNLRLFTCRYYRFWHVEPASFHVPALEAELSRVTESVFRRLINYADGRQIVLPLSGGYDSRLVATELKRLGYTNILSFSYGTAGNQEAEYSKGVAASLGLDWHFIEHSPELWQSAGDVELQKYRFSAANHASLPHVQDWLATLELRRQRVIQSDVILVPGHTGDFISGGHIPESFFSCQKLDQKDLLQAIISRHLSNSPRANPQFIADEWLEERVNSRLSEISDRDNIAFANLYESWEWQERQAKFIANSVRVYEWFHLDWWLPFWDLEFIRFWETVPLALRQERKWFKQWIRTQYGKRVNQSNQSQPFWKWQESSELKMLFKVVKKQIPEPILGALRSIRMSSFQRKRVELLGGVPVVVDIGHLMAQGYKVNGIFAEDFMARREQEVSASQSAFDEQVRADLVRRG